MLGDEQRIINKHVLAYVLKICHRFKLLSFITRVCARDRSKIG
jgi:hypothetical protein